MKIHRSIVGIAAAVFMLSVAAHAATSSIVVTPFQGELIGPGDFDRLVFDFTLAPPSGDADTLAAIGLRNASDARGIRDISKLVLWEDNGQPGFRGWEDKKIGTSTWIVDRTNWSFEGLNNAIPKEGKRFFVTAEIAGQILERKRLELVIPIADDRGTIGVYDAGDEGVFFGSKKVLPSNIEFAVSSGVLQTIHTRDIYPPLTYVTSPSRSGTVPLAPVHITGVTRERGRDFVNEIIVSISSHDGKQIAEHRPTISGKNNAEEWTFDWTPPALGVYTVSAIGIDDISSRETPNEGNTVTFTVTESLPPPAPPAPSPQPIPPSPSPEPTPAPAPAPPPVTITSPEIIRSWSCEILRTCDAPLTTRLSGRIILKVQGSGEAFYVNPVDRIAYFLGRPEHAFNVMRFLSVGITEDNFAKLQAGDSTLRARLQGRIVLRVQKNGEAWYLPHANTAPLYLGRPADAFAIMRKLGIGISDADLGKLRLEGAIVTR